MDCVSTLPVNIWEHERAQEVTAAALAPSCHISDALRFQLRCLWLTLPPHPSNSVFFHYLSLYIFIYNQRLAQIENIGFYLKSHLTLLIWCISCWSRMLGREKALYFIVRRTFCIIYDIGKKKEILQSSFYFSFGLGLKAALINIFALYSYILKLLSWRVITTDGTKYSEAEISKIVTLTIDQMTDVRSIVCSDEPRVFANSAAPHWAF